MLFRFKTLFKFLQRGFFCRKYCSSLVCSLVDEKWIDLFELALIAQENISYSELTKGMGTKYRSYIVDLESATANKKKQKAYCT